MAWRFERLAREEGMWHPSARRQQHHPASHPQRRQNIINHVAWPAAMAAAASWRNDRQLA